MRRILCFTLAFTMAFMCFGCNMLQHLPGYRDRACEEQTEKLMEYLSNDDTDGIKEMFCSVVSESTGFDDEAQEAVDFFDVEVDSYNLDFKLSDDDKEYGNINYAHISPGISVKTTTGKNYAVVFEGYIINRDHPEYIGISDMSIERKSDRVIFTLGDYYLVHPEKTTH